MITPLVYCKPIAAKVDLLWWQARGLSYTATGYGRKIPTQHKVQIAGSPRWYRVYCCIYSNSGTCYIVRNSQWEIVRDLPEVIK